HAARDERVCWAWFWSVGSNGARARLRAANRSRDAATSHNRAALCAADRDRAAGFAGATEIELQPVSHRCTSATCRSPTLVPVGPHMIKSPSGPKKSYAPFVARAASAFTPCRAARSVVV